MRQPDPSRHPTAAPGIGKWLARLRRRFISSVSGQPDPVVEAKNRERAYWTAILDHTKEKECPPYYFRKIANDMRRSGDLMGAESVCSRGADLHPDDLPIAIEHAEIAKALKNQEARLARCERVVQLGGASAPVVAFTNLAECHMRRGRLDLAEATIRTALANRPADFALQEFLAGVLAVAGANAQALVILESLIRHHPEKDQAQNYLRVADLLAEEGLLDRAAQTLTEGLGKYQDSKQLQQRLEEIDYLQKKESPPRTTGPSEEVTTNHLFLDFYEPYARGILCFPIVNNLLRQHVPAMLDFAHTVPAPDPIRLMPEVDVFAVWGDPTRKNSGIQKLAARENKPLLYIDSGFLSSPAIEGKENPTHSIVICPDGAYFDATRASHIENKLNSDDCRLRDDQRARAEKAIASIVSQRLSKYNHAPHINLRDEFPQDGTHRILLVDQKKGSGGSLHWSLGGPGTFERMFESALSKPGHEILIKIHPDAISGQTGSHFRPLLPDPLPPNIKIVDYDVNPFDLFDVVDEVYVATSILGFEAVMAGKPVHCFASPFYSGWGFTIDRTIVPRRDRKRDHVEIFHSYYIAHSRYHTPDNGVTEIEDLIDYLTQGKGKKPSPLPAAIRSELPAPSPQCDDALRILIVIPSGRFGATGRYIQNLSMSLIQQGCEIMILAEGVVPKADAGVRWLTLDFDGQRLTQSIRQTIIQFAPHFIYENGVRSRAQRAALEAMILTDARLAMQSEDDDIQIHLHKQGDEAASQLKALDRPKITTAEISKYLQNHDWNYSLNIFFDPNLNRWIEPLLRIACYRLASFHTAIWHPFAERLAREYGVPTLVVPPVASSGDFERIPLAPKEREAVLERHEIDPSRVVIFIGGALYNYSNEYAIFLDSLTLAAGRTKHRLAIVVASGRSVLPLGHMANERLANDVSFTDLGEAGDEVYTEMLKACDVVCSPGVPDTFNRYRLPSRLVKAMAMGKPILTCRCGFGESLEHAKNAFIMDGEDPADWADSIVDCTDHERRLQVGHEGRLFAREHFSSDLVATALKKQFLSTLSQPTPNVPHSVTTASETSIRERGANRTPSIRFQDKHHSVFQHSIRTLATRTHNLNTVICIGSDPSSELNDFYRLGADRVLTVMADVDSSPDSPHSYDMVTTQECRQRQEPALELEKRQLPLREIIASTIVAPGNHLLAIEFPSLTSRLLSAPLIPELHRFRWIITRDTAEGWPEGTTIETHLHGIGFQPVTHIPNNSDKLPAKLFERQSVPEPGTQSAISSRRGQLKTDNA